MHRILFYLSLLLSLVYAGLNLLESFQYQAWEVTLAQQHAVQLQLAYAQRQDSFNQELLKRLALESQHDLPLAELLKKHHIRVIFSGSQALVPAPTPPSDITGPVAPDKTPEAPASSPSPVHP
jgi:hypothetical protein